MYSAEVAERICQEIATSNKGLHAICKADGLPDVRTVFRWLSEHEDFRHNYARAKELQAEYLAEELIRIADESEHDTIHHEQFGDMPNNEWINRSRLRVDTRKWLMSKLLPKKYGDKLDVTTDGQPLQPITGMVVLPPKDEQSQ